jgi:phosphoserine phosphatase RsbU/P
MDIWSGNEAVENSASTPGLEIFVYSRPFEGERRGGDIHYVSLCAGGVVTRLMLADVSGHGSAVASTAQTLRKLMRRFMNSKSQTRLVRDLNREFTRLSDDGRFATAIVGTYLSHRNHFTLCNAGHPRPLWYRARNGLWTYVSDAIIDSEQAFNLPLGFDASVAYQQVGLTVGDGDILILYTDALTEARGRNDELLGENDLLQIVARQPTDDVRSLGHGLLEGVMEFSGDRPLEDDATIFIFKFSSARRRFPGWRERFAGYAKVLGLRGK